MTKLKKETYREQWEEQTVTGAIYGSLFHTTEASAEGRNPTIGRTFPRVKCTKLVASPCPEFMEWGRGAGIELYLVTFLAR